MKIDFYMQPKCCLEGDWKLVSPPYSDRIFATCEKCGKGADNISIWAKEYDEIFLADKCYCGNVILQSKCCSSNFDIVKVGEKHLLMCNECEEIIKNVEISVHGKTEFLL